ncbi:glutathione S-transferase N-terminal domain-containing protein [Candidatus Pacearchaeota archaeon]|nr:glutathione S-transferase N-terminal domain-containing protein [Candidatus Pacearchaeota archaeon]
MKKQKTILIYSTPYCPWCRRAKEFLKEHKIKFKNIDVSSNEKYAREMIQKSGQMGVPVIDINGEIIIGFDEERLKKALNIY